MMKTKSLIQVEAKCWLKKTAMISYQTLGTGPEPPSSFQEQAPLLHPNDEVT